jgi:hypothetical protein
MGGYFRVEFQHKISSSAGHLRIDHYPGISGTIRNHEINHSQVEDVDIREFPVNLVVAA